MVKETKKEQQIKCLSASDRRVAGFVGKNAGERRAKVGSTLMRRPSQEEREKKGSGAGRAVAFQSLEGSLEGP